jgi:hypothetical protein
MSVVNQPVASEQCLAQIAQTSAEMRELLPRYDDLETTIAAAVADHNEMGDVHWGRVERDVLEYLASARIAPGYGIIDPDYARIFTIARCIAWSEGYSLLMHGSFTRDLDLVAVPWREGACEPEHLVSRIADSADLRSVSTDPGEKAHGRLAWTLVFKAFGDPRFVDLSVMPRVSPARSAIAKAEGTV